MPLIIIKIIKLYSLLSMNMSLIYINKNKIWLQHLQSTFRSILKFNSGFQNISWVLKDVKCVIENTQQSRKITSFYKQNFKLIYYNILCICTAEILIKIKTN